MSNVIEQAQELLDGIEESLPFKVNEVTNPDAEEVLATIRGADGYPVIKPHPESMSILVAPRGVFEFIEKAPKTIQGLLDLIEKNNAPKTNRTTETS